MTKIFSLEPVFSPITYHNLHKTICPQLINTNNSILVTFLNTRSSTMIIITLPLPLNFNNFRNKFLLYYFWYGFLNFTLLILPSKVPPLDLRSACQSDLCFVPTRNHSLKLSVIFPNVYIYIYLIGVMKTLDLHLHNSLFHLRRIIQMQWYDLI